MGLARSTSSEYLRVGRALRRLPRLRALFGEGEVSWEQLRALSRVATAETEVEWLELAWTQPVAVVLAEVREAADRRPPLVRWADGIPSGAIPLWPAAQGSSLAAPEGEGDRPEALVLDRPNSARLARQVRHREGLVCANPGCGRRGRLHAHHIVFRSRGGRTALGNEVAVCEVCHALIHQGLLEVSGSPEGELVWRPRRACGGAGGAGCGAAAGETGGARGRARKRTRVDGRRHRSPGGRA